MEGEKGMRRGPFTTREQSGLVYCNTIPLLLNLRNPNKTSSSSSSCFLNSGNPIPCARNSNVEREVYAKTSLDPLARSNSGPMRLVTIVLIRRELVYMRQGYHLSYQVLATTSSLNNLQDVVEG